MIKIAYTIGTLLTGGAEVFIMNLIKNLDLSKFKMILIVLDKKNNTFLEDILEELNIEIYYMNKPEGFRPKTMFEIYRILKKFKPSIVHGNIGGIIYILPYLFLNRKTVGVHTCHTLSKYEFGKFKRIILKYFYKKKLIVPVCISKINYDDFVITYKLSTGVKLIYNGIDYNRFYYNRKFNDKSIMLGHVGRFEDVKNHGTIFRVYEELVKQNKKVCLKLIGKGSKLDYYKSKYRSEQIEFITETSSVEEELKSIDFFLFPSIYEGMPLSVIEAMASGCIILASDVGGLKELIENSENGYLLDPLDISMFVGKIIELSNNLNKMETISNNNINKAKLYSLNTMVEKYSELYIEVSK